MIKNWIALPMARGLWVVLIAAGAAMMASCRTTGTAGAGGTAFSFLQARGPSVVNEAGEEIVLKGCNLGNWLLLEMWMLDIYDLRDQYRFESVLAERFGPKRRDELMEIYRRNWITGRDFEIIRSFGFNVVRLPFHYSLLEDDDRPMELKPDAFRWLDRAVDMARKHGLYVILDLHGAPGGQSKDHTTGREDQNRLFSEEPCQQRTIWLWEQIAKHFKDQPAVAAYELLNEPFGDYKTERHEQALSALMSRIYAAIRAVDDRHLLIIPGSQHGIQLYGAPRDRGWSNVMFTEHYYPGVHGGPSGIEAQRHLINRTLVWLESYLKEIDAPLLVGEFNVVFRRGGGPAMMRQYYDLFAEKGWWGTMWSYKLVSRQGGLGRDNWYMVTNLEPMPKVSVRESSDNDIAALFRWFGTMNYAVYEDLREALTTDRPEPLALRDPAPSLSAPAQDQLAGWSGTDIASLPRGGQKVHSPTQVDVYGGGRDIWNERDEFRFFWQKPPGDFVLEATVDALEETNPYAKAGIMIRASLESDAPHVLAHVFPDGQVGVGWREAARTPMKEAKFPVREFPVRLRLRKTGDTVQTAYAVGDEDWVRGPELTFDWLAGNCLAGLAVLSHDNRYVARGSFSDVRISTEAP